jgi:hypothetical protein
MKVTRIYADEEGVSHFADFDVALEPGGEIGRLSSPLPGYGVIFRETESSYDYDWHRPPRKQWIVLLDGEISIETGDGATRTFRGGDVLLVEDLHGRGHKTRQTSPGKRRSVFIPIPT